MQTHTDADVVVTVPRAFNVVWPFFASKNSNSIMTVQMNEPMAKLLGEFIMEFADESDEGIETELYTLADYLLNAVEQHVFFPAHWTRREAKSTILVEKIEDAIMVHMTRNVQILLQNLITEAAPQEPNDPPLEKEIHVLGKALADPDGCYRLRQQKRENHRNNGGYHRSNGHHSGHGHSGYNR